MSAKEPARPRGSRKAEQVIDAAIAVFLTHGFDQTTMDAVAARAGVSKATVYAHYGDKLGLFRAVVERAGAVFDVDIEVAQDDTGTAEERLARVLGRFLQGTTDPQALALIRILVMESARRPDLGSALDNATWASGFDRVIAILEEDGRQCGYELADPRSYAILLLRMVSASLTLDCLLASEFHPDQALLDAHAEWVATVFLRGIRPRAADEGIAAPQPPGYSYGWLPELEEPGSS